MLTILSMMAVVAAMVIVLVAGIMRTLQKQKEREERWEKRRLEIYQDFRETLKDAIYQTRYVEWTKD